MAEPITVALVFTEEEILCLAQVLSDVAREAEPESLYDLEELELFKIASTKITDAGDVVIHKSRSSRR